MEDEGIEALKEYVDLVSRDLVWRKLLLARKEYLLFRIGAKAKESKSFEFELTQIDFIDTLLEIKLEDCEQWINLIQNQI